MAEPSVRLELNPPRVETPEIRRYLDKAAECIEQQVRDDWVELMVFGSVPVRRPLMIPNLVTDNLDEPVA